MSHPDSLARRPIDPAMGNSFGSYSEPGTRNNYQVETSPMVRDDDDVTPELRRRRGEGVRSHNVAKREADAEIGTSTDAESVETTEVVVEAASNEVVLGGSSEGAIWATELVSEVHESLDVEDGVTSAGVLEPNVLIRQRVVGNLNSCSVVTSLDSAYGTEANLRTSRPFEPDETLIKPTELSFETCRDITPTQCRSAPSQPKKARTDDGTTPRHVSHERRNPQRHSSQGSSVDSETASAIRHPNMDRKSHNDGSSIIRPELSIEAKSVIREENRTSSVIWIHRLQIMSTFKLPNQGTYDGTTPFETFWAQFQNCSVHNRWTKTEQLAYLRTSLQKETGQVLWDYCTEVTNSLKKLTKSDSAERIKLTNTESKFVTDEGKLVLTSFLSSVTNSTECALEYPKACRIDFSRI